MEARLRRYLSSGRYMTATTALPASWPGQKVDFEPADPWATELALLQIRARIRRDPAAAYATRQLLEQRPDDPRAYELLGAIANRDKEPELALDHWRNAVDRGSGVSYLHLALVQHELGQWLRGENLRQLIPDELAERWRGLLARALAIDPEDQRALYWLGWLEACARTRNEANVKRLEAAVPTQRKRMELFLNLAVIRRRSGDEATARRILQGIAGVPLERGRRMRVQLAEELGVELPAEMAVDPGPRKATGNRPIRIGAPQLP